MVRYTDDTAAEGTLPWTRLPKLRPSTEEYKNNSLDGSIKPERRLTNLTEDYVKHWKRGQAIDEYVQNWYDQIESLVRDRGYDVRSIELRYMDELPNLTCYGYGKWACGHRFRTQSDVDVESWWKAEISLKLSHDGIGSGTSTKYRLGYFEHIAGRNSEEIRMVNFCTALLPKCFLLGFSGAEKRRANDERGISRGKFGDGLPSSTLVLTRDPEAKVEIYSCGREYKFSMERNEDMIPCLTLEVEECAFDDRYWDLVDWSSSRFDVDEDTAVIIGFEWKTQRRPSASTCFDRSRYLFLRPAEEKRTLQEMEISATGAGEAASNAITCSMEILEDVSHTGRIYVKGMLVQQLSGRTQNRFGVNLLELEMQSRDRQDTIPMDTLRAEILSGWSSAAKQSCSITRRLYTAMSTDESCLEAIVLANKSTSEATDICDLLADFFASEYPDSIPVRDGDTRSKDIVREKLKKKPREVTARIYDALRRSSSLEVDAVRLWDEKKTEMMRSAEAVGRTPVVFSSLFAMLSKSFRGVQSIHPANFRLVTCPEAPDVGIAISGQAIDRFQLSGLRLYDWLNGFYSIAPGAERWVNHRPVFLKDPCSDYRIKEESPAFLYWASSSVVHVCADAQSLLKDVQTGALHRFVSFETPSGELFRDGQVDAEEFDFSGGFARLAKVSIVPAKRIVPDDIDICVNEDFFRNVMHDHESAEEKGKCVHQHANCCFCAFDELRDSVVEELRKKLRVPISESDCKKMIANLNALLYDQSFRQLFQLQIAAYKRGLPDPVDGGDEGGQRSADLAILRDWLRTGRPSAFESETAAEVRECVETLMHGGDLEMPKHHKGALAWLGDSALDFYLGMAGVHARLAPWQIDKIRRALFCTRNLGGDLGREIAEEREEDVGEKIYGDGKPGPMFFALRDIMTKQKIPTPTDLQHFTPVTELVKQFISDAKKHEDYSRRDGGAKPKGQKGAKKKGKGKETDQGSAGKEIRKGKDYSKESKGQGRTKGENGRKDRGKGFDPNCDNEASTCGSSDTSTQYNFYTNEADKVMKKEKPCQKGGKGRGKRKGKKSYVR